MVSKPETSFCSEKLCRDLKWFDQRTTLGKRQQQCQQKREQNC